MDIFTFEEDGEERIRGNNDFRLKREAIIESKSLKSDYFRKKKKKDIGKECAKIGRSRLDLILLVDS